MLDKPVGYVTMKVYISFITVIDRRLGTGVKVHLEEPGGAGSHPAEAFVKGIVSPHTMPQKNEV
jgi:hypothetical protein